ncbi:peptidylprolyl isomerase [Sphingomonas montana]|uniref:peptidylprolyl isomerase n=1 Tax=Sphingomonas montana TaxID=1843236 RepID=UPI00096BEFE8|nr:peptidylprolyl isomerase [Sphingomonas montana]
MRNRFLLAAMAGLLCSGGALAQARPEQTEATVPKALPKIPQATPVEAFLPPPLTAENTFNLDLSTGGRVVIQLRPDKAPVNVARVKTLAQQGFYNGLPFHRVIDGFMAQGGDPKGDGTGGSPLPDLKAEFNDMPHVRGEVSMARSQQPNSANSQFFIMLAPNLGLDGNYTAIGRVVSGMEYVDLIEKGEPPANPSRIVRATLGAPFVASAEPAAAPAPVAVPAAEPVPVPPAGN